MATFRSKPEQIEAIQWTGDNFVEVSEFTGGMVRATSSLTDPKNVLLDVVDTNSGLWMNTIVGDYIVRSLNTYEVVDEITFEARYEPLIP